MSIQLVRLAPLLALGFLPAIAHAAPAKARSPQRSLAAEKKAVVPAAEEPPAVAPAARAAAIEVESPAERSAAATTALAAQAAHDAAEAAKAAAEAAHATAQAVHELAGHVEDIEHTEPSVAPAMPMWGYQLGINALSKHGNASNFSGQVNLQVNGHWRLWRTEFLLKGTYGQSDPVGDTADTRATVTALNGTVSARGERFYMPFLSQYALVSMATDLVASIEYQASGELGLTLTWFEVERDDYVKRRLRTSIAVEAMHESRRTYFPVRQQDRTGRWIVGPPVTIDFRYALAKNIYAQESLKILYNINNARDYRVTSVTKLAAAVTDHVGLQVGLETRYIGVPAAGRQARDLELSAGLNFTF